MDEAVEMEEKSLLESEDGFGDVKWVEMGGRIVEQSAMNEGFDEVWRREIHMCWGFRREFAKVAAMVSFAR